MNAQVHRSRIFRTKNRTVECRWARFAVCCYVLDMVHLSHKFVVVIFATYFCCVWGRAVNISNTWVLPEEGFPVFYRYFRDRISWYEADAVCQFHHGNLVTVGNTSQFDAVRAYLKELDIINNVWIGLTRPSDKTTYAWSGNKPSLGDGFWGEVSAVPGIAVCAAADPAADFRWHALTCGGPEVASFICELPVPPWALGVNGCMLTSLPSLTVIYLPEQTALELTSDCGLDGTKRIACKGNADQQEMMRQLSCGITHDDFDEKVGVSKAPAQSTTADVSSNSINSNELNMNGRGIIAILMATATATTTAIATTTTTIKTTTKPSTIWTSNTIDTSEFGSPTRHRRETEDTAAGIRLRSTTDITAHERHMDTTTSSFNIRPYMTSNVNGGNKFVIGSTSTSTSTTSDPLPETNRQRPSRKSRDREPSFTTTETSTVEIPTNHPAEYPSINQGQLFSIIENGTIFDIIEVNDTSETDPSPSSSSSSSSSSLLTNINHGMYTTKNVFKESTTSTPAAPLSSIVATLDLNKKPAKHSNKSPNDLIDGNKSEKTFMKTIELETTLPSDTSSLVKLNRTNRKELPLVDSTTEQNKTDIQQRNKEFIIPSSPAMMDVHVYPTTTTKGSTININDNNDDDDDHDQQQQQQHKIVEITITDIERKTDATKFYVTTKKYDYKKNRNRKYQNILYDEKNNTTTVPVIMNNKNIEISELSTGTGNNITDTNNVTKDGNILIHSKIRESMDSTQRRNATAGENTQSKSIVDEDNGEYEEDIIESKDNDDDDDNDDNDDVNKTTEEPVEPIPEAQPRPNRNRVLTRPQRRSFYPYFFSRVLG